MRHHYALEKLGAAVYTMATSPESIKRRLWGAYLVFHTLSNKDFSDGYRDDWNFIYDTLTTAEASFDHKGEVTTGKVENTLKVLDEETCVAIAERICNLEARLRDAYSA